MKRSAKFRSLVLVPLLAAAGIGAVLASGAMRSTEADAAPPATPPAFPALSATIPSDIPGGAGHATISSAATFAWQEFIALNWPAKAQTGAPMTRGQANTAQKFGSDNPDQPVVWETMRSKVETFPGVGNPPGYVPASTVAAPDFGYDHLPVYTYGTRTKTASPIGKLQNNPGGPPLVVAPCPHQAAVATPAFVNLDETTQIGEDAMFAGIVQADPTPFNGQPQLNRFLAKGNRAFDLSAQARKTVDEESHRGTGADADDASVLDELQCGFGGQAFLIVLVHAVDSGHSMARMVFHCAAVTGSTERRLPRRIRANSPRASARWRNSSSAIVRLSLRSNATSTASQRGSSGLLFGSW